jgi:hypothetical protein
MLNAFSDVFKEAKSRLSTADLRVLKARHNNWIETKAKFEATGGRIAG